MSEQKIPCKDLSNELSAFTDTIQETIKTKTDKITADINTKADELNHEDSNGNVGIGLNFDVTWSEIPVKFHLPSFSIQDKEVILDLPTFTTNQKDIIFNFPECHMEDKVVGRYPEFHGLSVVWRDIITSVPVCVNKEQKISIGIPEAKMERKTIIMGLPVVEMKEVEMKVKYPEFKLENVSVELKQKSEELEKEGKENLQRGFEESRNEIMEGYKNKHTSLFDCLRSELLLQKSEALSGLDSLITGFTTSINDMKQKNVPSDNGTLKQTEENLNMFIEQRHQIEINFQSSLDQLNTEQQSSLEQFVQKFIEGFKLDSSSVPA
ncbi:hypothetical protein [Priestia megaterium]|uniref:hypothetical protein n=1 Tax=Priestia megaterium TaxID=1404 RepID=UPI0035B5E3F0